MLIRASIVVLVILNLGVALWWATRGELQPPRATESNNGVATLELMPVAASETDQTTEVGAMPASAPAADSAPLTAQPVSTSDVPAQSAQAVMPEPEIKPAPAPEQCLSLGPFLDRSQAEAGMARLSGIAARTRLREVPAIQSGNYRVWIPPAASRDEAQATAARIVGAGLGDYYVISQGDDANAVALGQYRNRDGAERRLAAVKAAGFATAAISRSSEVAASWWIDTAVISQSSATAVAARSGALRQQSLDCIRLR